MTLPRPAAGRYSCSPPNAPDQAQRLARRDLTGRERDIATRSLILCVALTSFAAHRGQSQQLPSLTIVAPAAPGGGWDQLAREMERELEASGLAGAVQVENVPGAAGTIGL